MWSKWGLSLNKDGPSIRRYRKLAGRVQWERYPKDKYRALAQADLEALVRRLNASLEAEEIAARARFIYDHAYVNTTNLERFEAILLRKSKGVRWPRDVMFMLHNYVFAYFIQEKKLADPKLWKQFDDQWAIWLKAKRPVQSKSKGKMKLSGKSLKLIVQAANQYLSFLEDKIYIGDQIGKLKPFVKGELTKLGQTDEGRFKYISSTDWKRVIAVLSNEAPEVVIPAKLCYLFGLRSSESLSLRVSDVRNNYLLVERQLFKLDSVVSTKNFKPRKVPYWKTTAKEAYELISKLQPMHPSTFQAKFNQTMAEAKLDFKTHDMRRTFITDALDNGINPFAVKEAVGHSEFNTTMKYYQAKSKIDDDVFVP